MLEIKNTSTNGRWGITVVCEDDIDFPAKGILKAFGTIEGHKIFQFTASEDGSWIVIGGDLKPIAGCKVVACDDLQSSRCVTILAGGSFMAWKSYGYKGRSSSVNALKNGQQVTLSAAVMAVMELIPSKKHVVDTAPPPIDSALAEALKKAGL